MDVLIRECNARRQDPKQRSGDTACPFTTLYWDFLIRHADRLRDNSRMALQVRNLERLDADEKQAIRNRAKQLRIATGPSGD